MGGVERGKGTSKWMLYHGGEHRGKVTRVVISEWDGNIGIYIDVVHGN